jgi:hypothetical protein
MQITPGSAFFKSVFGSAGVQPDPGSAPRIAAAAQRSVGDGGARQNEVARRVEQPSQSGEIRRDLPRGSFVDIKV